MGESQACGEKVYLGIDILRDFFFFGGEEDSHLEPE